MPRPYCTVCEHRERAAIDIAIARGISLSALAKRYRLGKDSLWRHKTRHLSPPLKARLLAGPDLERLDLDRLRETESQSLLSHLIALRHRLFQHLDWSEEARDLYAANRTVAALHHNIEVVGKLLGDLGVGSTTINNNVLLAPAYLELRVALVRALEPFPEAARAVAAVLHQLEGKAAAAIKADKRELAVGPAPALTIEHKAVNGHGGAP